MKSFAAYAIVIVGMLVVIFMLAFGLSFVTGAVKSINESTYEVTVTDKEAKRDGSSSKYLIFVELEDGSTRVFQNTDDYYQGKYDSSDYYAQINVGEEYTFTTTGWRVKFISWYENIVDFERKED